MLASIVAAALIVVAPVQATMQVPVADPELPNGPLVAFGPIREGALFLETSSFRRSDIGGLTRGTAVIVTKDADQPLWVMTFWIDCRHHVYQVGAGRRYDAEGRQVRLTAFVPDQSITPDSGVARAQAALCQARDPDLTGLAVVADYRAALAASPGP